MMPRPQSYLLGILIVVIAATPAPAEAQEPAIAASSIHFLDSFAAGMVRAQSQNKRIFLFFSGDGCVPCRKHEQVTHTDSRIISLAKKFVCVKLKTGTAGEELDRYNVSSIPRTLVINADGRVISEQVGYREPDEHARWLEAALSASASKGGSAPRQLPEAVGADAERADLLIWFVEQDDQEIDDSEASRHAELLAGLRKLALSPRIEYVYRSEFVDLLRDQNKSPDLIASKHYSGYLRKTCEKGDLTLVLCDRLQWPNRRSPVHDFRRRWVWTHPDWQKRPELKKAINWLLLPKRNAEPGQTHRFAKADEHELVRIAEEMTMAHQTGNLDLMAKHWSEDALEKSLDFVDEPEYRRLRRVKTGPTQLFGTNQVAVALVEVRFETVRGKNYGPQVGSSTACVVLHRTKSDWKVFNVRTWYFSLTDEDFDALCRTDYDVEPTPSRRITITSPVDRSELRDPKPVLKWKLEPAKPAPLIQVVEVVVKPRDREHWPADVLHYISPGEPTQREYPFHQPCRWRVWAIERDGTISFSPIQSFTFESESEPTRSGAA